MKHTPDKSIDPSEAERLHLLVTSIKDYAIYMLDPEGHITSWNAGAERFKGYAAEEVLGRHYSIFLTLEDQAGGMPARALKIAREEGRYEAEGWRVRKDGSRFWASVVIDAIKDSSGNLLGYAKITRDITDRKVAQETLRASEEQFRLLVQGVTDYAIFMLSPEGVVTNWNSGAEHIKGYTQEEIIGQHFSRFYLPEDQALNLPTKALAIAAEVGRYEQEGWRVRKDGSRFRAHVVVDAIRNAMGELIGFAKITRDITEKDRANEELQRANAALFQSQKMDAIGKLTGGIAHDFNNLLAVMSSGLEVLMMRSEDSSEIKMLESMQRAVSRGATLTQQLLSFARQQPLQSEKHNINRLIESFDAILRRAANTMFTFNMQLSPKLQNVLIDAPRFEAALLNIVINARDAMPDGGTLSIITENVALENNQVGTLKAGEYVRLSIADTGSGMTPEVAAHAFEPFFTTKEIGKGTGLGLSQVYGFIIQSGGDIVLETAVGKGSTFMLYLPALPSNYEGEAPSQQIKDKVLVVEDEPDVMLATAALFRSIGYEVITASSGSDALEILQRTPDIDVMFTDVMMPNGMSGIILARASRQVIPDLKIILTSGYPMNTLQADLGKLEDFTFIHKPYRLAELARKLRI